MTSRSPTQWGTTVTSSRKYMYVYVSMCVCIYTYRHILTRVSATHMIQMKLIT
jgi:hypothetical protein